MTDIVERLREYEGRASSEARLCIEAATEIERLRNLLNAQEQGVPMSDPSIFDLGRATADLVVGLNGLTFSAESNEEYVRKIAQLIKPALRRAYEQGYDTGYAASTYVNAS